MAFVTDHVEPGARVITDGWQGYHGVEQLGYLHDRHSQRAALARGDDPHELLPAVHRVASLVKRWLLGTHQGSVGDAHLPGYLNEFVFRFNRRRSRSRGLVFFRVLQLAATHAPVRYQDLVAHTHPRALPPTPPPTRGHPPSLERPPANRPWRAGGSGLLRLNGYPRSRKYPVTARLLSARIRPDAPPTPRLQWHTYDHWAETPGAHPTISHYIPGISRYISVYLGSFFLFAGTKSAGPRIAPRVQRHGRRRMLEPHLHTLAALIAEQPDRTLAELKDALGTPASLATIWRAVAALDVTVKKNGPALRTRST